MAQVVVYGDIDGVFADWEGRALEIYGLEKNLGLREFLKRGGELEDKLFNLRERVSEVGVDFWSEIKPFTWAQGFEKRLSGLGVFSFLTSSGNHNIRPKYASEGAAGKLIWLSNHFNGVPVSICRDKYVHAHSKAILIDDNKRNVKKFIESGGNAYLFPHPYRIEDGEISLDEVYQGIKDMIVSM